MTFLLPKHISFSVLCLSLTIGCADAQMSEGNARSDNVNKTKTSAEQRQQDSLDESEKADEPVAVGGAFIVCRELGKINLQHVNIVCSLENDQGLVEITSEWQGESRNPAIEVLHRQGETLYHEEFVLQSTSTPLVVGDSKDIEIMARFLPGETDEVTLVTSDLEQALVRGGNTVTVQEEDFTKASFMFTRPRIS